MNGGWLIIVGVALVGFCIYQFSSQSDRSPAEPLPPIKFLLYGLSLFLWGAAAYLFYNIAWQSGWMIFCYLVGSIVAFSAGRRVWRKAEEYNKIELENLGHKYQVQAVQNNLREQQIRNRHLPWEVGKRIQLDHTELESRVYSSETGREGLELDREEQRLRKSVLERSRQTGVPPDVINEVERERELGRVKTQQQYEEAAAVMAAGDILDTKDIQVIKKLTNDLAEEVRKRQAVIDGNDAQAVKDILIAQHTANIEHIQRQINERQGRLVSSPNGKETRGTGEATSDLRGHQEPGDERPQEQVPTQRRRGRPRKNPPQ